MRFYVIYVAVAGQLELFVSVDNTADTYADGSHVGYTEGWLASMHTTIAADTKVLAVVGYNAGGPAGLLVTLADGLVVSDTSWKCTTSAPSGDCKSAASTARLTISATDFAFVDSICGGRLLFVLIGYCGDQIDDDWGLMLIDSLIIIITGDATFVMPGLFDVSKTVTCNTNGNFTNFAIK